MSTLYPLRASCRAVVRPGHARADDARGEPVGRRRHLAAGGVAVVRGDALEVADADRRVDFLAAAGVLARAGAHAAEAAGEDVVLAVELEGVGVATVGDQRDVPRDVRVRRARGHARDVVGEPLRVTREQRVALAGPDRERREEGGVDERQQPDAAAVLDIDVVSLPGDAQRLELAGGHADLGGVHGAEAVGRRPARRARVRGSDTFVDPATDFTAEHERFSGVGGVTIPRPKPGRFVRDHGDTAP